MKKGEGMMFRHKPLVTTIRLINRIEPGSGVLFRDNFKPLGKLEKNLNPSTVLVKSFTWSLTPEGHEFWSGIFHKLTKEEIEIRKNKNIDTKNV